ncbi:MAG: TSCPD domain-containing protein [Magnetococcales bacterium]|nr:TSCPD domain-containing protein [Magnetococcales bacterium]
MADPVRIENPITDCAVVTAPSSQKPEMPPPVVFHRDPVLDGATYKLKPPESDHAVYVTINHAVMNGAPRLMEIFVNSKNMEHFAWVVALTRVISAIFRHESRPTFLVEELRSVFDPRGGYWAGGRYVPSLVAEIGNCLQQHMERLGIVEQDDPTTAVETNRKTGPGVKPQGICEKCGAFAVVFSGGCDKCQECGFSKRCGDA